MSNKSAAQILIDLGVDRHYWSANVQNGTHTDPKLGKMTSVTLRGLRELGDFGEYVPVTGVGKTNAAALKDFDARVEAANDRHQINFRKMQPFPAVAKRPTGTVHAPINNKHVP